MTWLRSPMWPSPVSTFWCGCGWAPLSSGTSLWASWVSQRVVCVCWQHSFRIAVVTTVQGCVQLIIFKKCVWIILCSLHYAFVCPYAISRAVCSQQLSEHHIRVSATPGDPAAEWGTGTHEERASPRTHQTWCQNAKSKVTVVRAAVQYIMFKITFCYTCSIRYIKYRMDN